MILPEHAKAVFLGFIQGLSEFLPISSSGHLVLSRFILNIPSFDLFFILVLHLGTLAAIFSYYKKDLLKTFKHFILKPLGFSGPGKLIYLLAWATLPGALGAFLIVPLVKKSLLQAHWTGWGFILTATCLFFTRWSLKQTKKADVPHFNDGTEDWNQFSFSTAFFIGLAQLCTFFPGMSRSGWTIATALFLGQSQRQAACFSFLLSIPAILGGVFFELLNQSTQRSASLLSLILAFLSSWFFGYIALKWLIRSLKSLSFPFFAFYLWPMGLFIIFFFNTN